MKFDKTKSSFKLFAVASLLSISILIFFKIKFINNDHRLEGISLSLDVKTNDENKLTRKLPSAIIIGSSKCGTTTLLVFIGYHPNVAIASKEVYFFSRNYAKGLEWYIEQMPLSNKQQITIDKTPLYLISKEAPKRIFDLNPKMKLILVLRDPVVRAVSDYVMKYGDHNDGNLLSASEQFGSFVYNRNGEINKNHFLVFKGLYYKYLQNWLKYFPKEQILFINGHEFIRDPRVEIEKLQTFLNVTHVLKKEHFVRNDRKGFYCIKNPSNLEEFKCMNEKRGRQHPTINETILNDLRDFYRSSDEMLFKFLNESPWWPI